MRLRTALISVSDKTGLPELGAALAAAGVQMYATGGTAAALIAANLPIQNTDDLTGFDTMLDGRVKTLHPNIHGAILADMQNPAHAAELQRRGMQKFDLVVVNFYPFEKAATTATSLNDVIENIDIGGPAMARAAAKNHASTVILSDPADYPLFIAALKLGDFNEKARRDWAMRAFVKVAHLDAAIANYFGELTAESHPSHRFFHFEKITDLAYGENPHQLAACYRPAGAAGGFAQLQGATVSYNNLLDAYAASRAAAEFSDPTAVIVKHNNPCGIATAADLPTALLRARQTDPVSAYGGVVAFNRPVDKATAQALLGAFWEVVIAPQYEADAKSELATRTRLRLLLTPPSGARPGHQLAIAGGLALVQEWDVTTDEGLDNVVSARQPTNAERADLRFAWRAAAAVKSNAIVLARARATVGIGAGQMSRIDSARLACDKAQRVGNKTQGSVAASDGFFPFADGVKTLAKAGITAIIHPGGSKNDPEIIATTDAANLAMIMTTRRHFRH